MFGIAYRQPCWRTPLPTSHARAISQLREFRRRPYSRCWRCVAADLAVGGDLVDEQRIPVIERAAKVLQEDDRRSALGDVPAAPSAVGDAVLRFASTARFSAVS